MAKAVNQITVFVSSPDDVKRLKQTVKEVCEDITRGLGKTRDIYLKTIDWKRDVVPFVTGEGAQSVINRQVQDYDYDVYLGIMWKRFGDRQPNGLTPTEEEFEIAFDRNQKTKRPVLQFYFKLDKYYPDNSYDANQALRVQEFKEKRIKPLGIYDGFKGNQEFRRKVTTSLLHIVETLEPFRISKKEGPKIKYHEVPQYITRKVCLAKDYDVASRLFLRNELTHSLVNVILQQKRIVLLSDAGVGKTIELQQVAWYFSTGEKHLNPLLVSLNKYVQSLSELLPPNWNEIPESQLLLVLDGLDEIESQNRRAAIRQIETFSDQHPDARIIVSCRTNFYNLETKQISGTLSKFSSYILLNLNAEDIQNYIDKALGNFARDFNNTIIRNQLQELLKIDIILR